MNTKTLARKLLLSALIFLTIANVTAQTNWRYITSDIHKNIVSIDTNFIRLDNGIMRVWQKTEYPNGSKTVSLFEWNCKDKMSRIIEGAYYENNVLIELSNKPTTWGYAIPDTTGMFVYASVCKNKRENDPAEVKKENLILAFAQIIVGEAHLMETANANGRMFRKIAIREKLLLISEKSVGGWYQVFDARTKSSGWLHGNNFKIVKAKKPPASAKKKIRRR